jgi:uncharacterized protein (DUF433 family)
MSQDSSKLITIDSHIETTSGTCGGRPRISGHRIRVQDVVIWCERMGLSADEVVARYPQLKLADVYAALAYYHDHREPIDAQMNLEDRIVEEMRGLFPSKVKTKFLADE